MDKNPNRKNTEVAQPDIYILTEGGVSKGFGHIARCYALYQAFTSLSHSCNLIVNGDDSVKKIVNDTGFTIVDWINDAENFLSGIDQANSILIIDSYQINPEQLAYYSDRCKNIAFLDDHGRLDYPSGLILVPINFLRYLKVPYDIGRDMLVGKEYILIRQPFWQVVSQRNIENKVKRVLIMMGGMDVENLSLTVINVAMNQFKEADFDFVYNRTNLDLGQLEQTYGNRLRHYANLNAEEMCELMGNVDLAVITAGQAAYELLSMGVPTIQVSVAENQIWALHALKEIGYFDTVLDFHSSTYQEDLERSMKLANDRKYRLDMRNIGMEEVNGRGAVKLANDILRYFNQSI